MYWPNRRLGIIFTRHGKQILLILCCCGLFRSFIRKLDMQKTWITRRNFRVWKIMLNLQQITKFVMITYIPHHKLAQNKNGCD